MLNHANFIHFLIQGGADAGGWEEYFDYIFPEDEGAKPNLKLLAMAKMWKKQKDIAPSPPDTSNAEEPIPISEEIPETSNNEQDLDADDEDIKNESTDSSESESDDENDEPEAKRKKE